MRRATGSHKYSCSPSSCRRSQPRLQLIRPPPIRHRIWSSHLEFRRLPSHSATQKSLKMPGRDKERLFPDCRREEKAGKGFLKYLRVKRSRWNEEVLFCFIFDVGKLRWYTGLPFKSQRCHSRSQFTMTSSRLLGLWGGKDEEQCLHGSCS